MPHVKFCHHIPILVPILSLFSNDYRTQVSSTNTVKTMNGFCLLCPLLFPQHLDVEALNGAQ